MHMGIPSLPNSRSHTPSHSPSAPRLSRSPRAARTRARERTWSRRTRSAGPESAAPSRVPPDNCGRHQHKTTGASSSRPASAPGRSSHPGTRCRPGTRTPAPNYPAHGQRRRWPAQIPLSRLPRCPPTPGGPLWEAWLRLESLPHRPPVPVRTDARPGHTPSRKGLLAVRATGYGTAGSPRLSQALASASHAPESAVTGNP